MSQDRHPYSNHCISAQYLATWAAQRMQLSADVAADLVFCNPHMQAPAMALLLNERLQLIQNIRLTMYCLLLDIDRDALSAERLQVERAGQHAAHLITGLIAGLLDRPQPD